MYVILFYSIQIKYGNAWGPIHPDMTSYISNKDISKLYRRIYTFWTDEYLTKILVKSSYYITMITLRTNRRFHGYLREGDTGVSTFDVSSFSAGVSYFTGSAKCHGKSSNCYYTVSGLQMHNRDSQGKQQERGLYVL